MWDGGNIVVNPRNGLYGAVIIGPKDHSTVIQ